MFDGAPTWKHFLFVSAEQKDTEQTRRLADFQSLVEARAPEGFQYEYACYPEENHRPVALPDLCQNLKQLFMADPHPKIGTSQRFGTRQLS